MQRTREASCLSIELDSFQSVTKKVRVEKSQTITASEEYHFYLTLTKKFGRIDKEQALDYLAHSKIPTEKAFLESAKSGDLIKTKQLWNTLYSRYKDSFYSARYNAIMIATLHNQVNILNFLLSNPTFVLLTKTITNKNIQEIHEGKHVFGTIQDSSLTLYFKNDNNSCMTTTITLANNKNLKNWLNENKEFAIKEKISELEIDGRDCMHASHISKHLKSIREFIDNAGGDVTGIVCESDYNNSDFTKFLQMWLFVMTEKMEKAITHFWLSELKNKYQYSLPVFSSVNQSINSVNMFFILLAYHGCQKELEFISKNPDLNKWIDMNTLKEAYQAAYRMNLRGSRQEIVKLFLMNALLENNLDLFIELRKSTLTDRYSDTGVELIIFELCISQMYNEKLSDKAKMLLFAANFSLAESNQPHSPFTCVSKYLCNNQIENVGKPDKIGEILNHWHNVSFSRSYYLENYNLDINIIIQSIIFNSPQLLEKMTMHQWIAYFPKLAMDLFGDVNMRTPFIEVMTNSLLTMMTDKIFAAQFLLLIRNIDISVICAGMQHPYLPHEISLIIYDYLVHSILNDNQSVIPANKTGRFSPRLFAVTNQNAANETMEMDVEAPSLQI